MEHAWSPRAADRSGSARNCIVLENAVVRATADHPCTIGDHCLVGPNSHVVGAEIGDEVFIATGAAVFHGAGVGEGVEIRMTASFIFAADLRPAPSCRSAGSQ